MKKITVSVSHIVPHWNFCNSDNLDMDCKSKTKCRFCTKTKDGYTCMLYNESLLSTDGLINKTRACCKATAGIDSRIDVDRIEPSGPTVPPKELIKQTIDLYSKTLNTLINQGYPRPIAEKVARKHILGDG